MEEEELIEVLYDDLSDWKIRLTKMRKYMDLIELRVEETERDNMALRDERAHLRGSSTRPERRDVGLDPWRPTTATRGTNTEKAGLVRTDEAESPPSWARELQEEMKDLRCAMREEMERNSRWRDYLTERKEEKCPQAGEKGRRRDVADGGGVKGTTSTARTQEAPKGRKRVGGRRVRKEESPLQSSTPRHRTQKGRLRSGKRPGPGSSVAVDGRGRQQRRRLGDRRPRPTGRTGQVRGGGCNQGATAACVLDTCGGGAPRPWTGAPAATAAGLLATLHGPAAPTRAVRFVWTCAGRWGMSWESRSAVEHPRRGREVEACLPLPGRRQLYLVVRLLAAVRIGGGAPE